MPRATRPTIVYRYGARVVDGLDAYHAEERAMHRAQNALIELRRDEIEAAREALRTHVPWVADTEAELERIGGEIEELRAAIRRQNARQRRREPDPEARARIRDLQAERRTLIGPHGAGDDACACFRCRRRRAFCEPAVAAALAAVRAEHISRRKGLYAAREISWADWNEVARRIPSSGVPQFRAWRNTGGLVVTQLTGGGASWADLLAGESHTSHVSVEAVPTPPDAGKRRRARPRYLLRLRVGADSRTRQEHRWVTARMTLHRPVPDDAIVQQVQLVRRRTGTHDQWHVHLILSREAGWKRSSGQGTAALNLGFRAVGTESYVVRDSQGRSRRETGTVYRVGYLVDDQGHVEAIETPARLDGLERRAESLQGIRDRNFDVARAGLLQWLASADVPDWFREATASLAQWRSAARLAALVIRWRGERFDGDDEMFERIETWRQQDRHLYDWQAFTARRVRRRRKELYRVTAARLRARYAVVLIDDTDYRALLRTPDAEDHEDPERLNRRWQLRLCSPGLLRDAIVQAGIGRPVPAAGATVTCSACGADAHPEWDRVSEIQFRCEAGHQIDQDQNAAANMLAASGGVVAD